MLSQDTTFLAPVGSAVQHNKIHSANHTEEAREIPKLSFPGLDIEKTYLVVGLDIDAPFPSFGVLGPILDSTCCGRPTSRAG